jgi:lipopolysaccharide transport system permease protein
VVTFLVTSGMALFIATCNVFLRDIERLVSLILMLWFYMTPVLYKPEMAPERYQWLVKYANPLAPCIIAWRSVFLDHTLPIKALGTSAAWGIIFFVIGYQVYRRLEWRFAELV